MTLTIEQIKQLKVGDTVYLKHNKIYDKSVGKTVTVSKIGRKYIELDGTSHKIVIETGEITKDYRGYAPTLYQSEEYYEDTFHKYQFILKVRKYCEKLQYAEAKVINEILGLGFELEKPND